MSALSKISQRNVLLCKKYLLVLNKIFFHEIERSESFPAESSEQLWMSMTSGNQVTGTLMKLVFGSVTYTACIRSCNRLMCSYTDTERPVTG